MAYTRLNKNDGDIFNASDVTHMEDGIVQNESDIAEVKDSLTDIDDKIFAYIRNQDCDNCANGAWIIQNPTNSPSSITQWCCLFSFANVSRDTQLQIAVGLVSHSVFMRHKSNGNWLDWEQSV